MISAPASKASGTYLSGRQLSGGEPIGDGTSSANPFRAAAVYTDDGFYGDVETLSDVSI